MTKVVFVTILTLVPLIRFLVLTFLCRLITTLIRPISSQEVAAYVSKIDSNCRLVIGMVTSAALLFILDVTLIITMASWNFEKREEGLPSTCAVSAGGRFGTSHCRYDSTNSSKGEL